MGHETFMAEALKEARKAFEEGEIPVGAVVVCENRIIGKGYNQTQKLHDVTAHAEMIAITAAANYLGAKYLNDCTMYVTLEPCIMCAGAIGWAQLGGLIIGSLDEKKGFLRVKEPVLHPKTEILTGILSIESKEMLLEFFQNLRQ
ncbi:MAG: nucleoside deaminase [Opitutaceae bacterium]|nr:nucleoside deaminase [Cytophagales bacterium]